MTEGKFIVEFRFDGGLATRGVLDGSDHVTATEAARRLLALHAHTLFGGEVPRNALSQSGAYRVVHVGTRVGCSVDGWEVWVLGSGGAVLGVAKWYADTYRSEIRDYTTAAARAAQGFLRDSINAVLRIGSRDLPAFPRIEPVLSSIYGNGEPMIDLDALDENKRELLRAITVQVLHDLARPVGRSAELLSILIDGQLVAEIDERAKARLYEDQISDFVHRLPRRQQRATGQTLP